MIRSRKDKTFRAPTPPLTEQSRQRSIPPVSTKQKIEKSILDLESGLSDEEREYRLSHPIEYFSPIGEKPGELPYQKQVLDHLHAGKKVIALVGANGIGKTVLGAVITASACLGIEPWSGRETVWGRRPVKVRILCTDWEKHAAMVMIPKLKEYFPRGEYETKKNNIGIEALFRFRTGSTVELITNKQDTRDHEGWEGDLIWGDEEFDRDKFVANIRGLRRPEDKGGMGVFLLTQTAVTQAWILDDIIRNTDPAYASVTEIPQDANPHLSEEFKRVFRASLREDEKVPRVDGGWLSLVGLVWKAFKPDVHVIDDFQVPLDWPVVALIDWHVNKPHAIGFYAVDPRNMIYTVDEIWENGSAEEMADKIIRKKRDKSWRVTEAFIDPLSKGDTAYVKNMGIEIKDSFTRLKEALWQERIDLKVASKDKSSGIRNVEEMLKGINGLPSLFFFRSLANKIDREGHIWEIQRWNYDENGKPRDEADHFCENLYRMTLTGIKYSPMGHPGHDLKSETDFDVFSERREYAA